MDFPYCDNPLAWRPTSEDKKQTTPEHYTLHNIPTYIRNGKGMNGWVAGSLINWMKSQSHNETKKDTKKDNINIILITHCYMIQCSIQPPVSLHQIRCSKRIPTFDSWGKWTIQINSIEIMFLQYSSTTPRINHPTQVLDIAGIVKQINVGANQNAKP